MLITLVEKLDLNTMNKQKYKIYLDTTDRYNKLVNLIKVENDKETVIIERNGELDVSQTIADLLKEANLTPEEVLEYNANPGPGSFTGIKIGITIANVLNWVTGKKSLSELKNPNYGKEPNISTPK